MWSLAIISLNIFSCPFLFLSPSVTPICFKLYFSIISFCLSNADEKFSAMLCYAKSLQSCPTLCDPIDGSPPGSVVPGIL